MRQDKRTIQRLGKRHGAQKLRYLIAEATHAGAEHDVALGVDRESIGRAVGGEVREEQDQEGDQWNSGPIHCLCCVLLFLRSAPLGHTQLSHGEITRNM